MEISLSEVNWIAVAAAFVVGQIMLTLWFTVLFGKPWALAFGAQDRAEHSKAVPGYTYALVQSARLS